MSVSRMLWPPVSVWWQGPGCADQCRPVDEEKRFYGTGLTDGKWAEDQDENKETGQRLTQYTHSLTAVYQVLHDTAVLYCTAHSYLELFVYQSDIFRTKCSQGCICADCSSDSSVACLVIRVWRKHRKRLSLGASKVDSAVNKNASSLSPWKADTHWQDELGVSFSFKTVKNEINNNLPNYKWTEER